MTKYSFLRFVREQWGRPVPLVTEDLTGKAVLVTGANVGLGFEAAKHLASMNPERLIIACRSESKGNQAVKEIKESVKFDNVELFIVDLSNYASVNAFCEKVDKEVPRLDILVENAALAQFEFIPTPDGWEHQVQVNHLATAQVAILLLPLLLRTASMGTTPRLVFVSTAAHHTSPPLRPPTSDQGILDWLNDKSTTMRARYSVSKLLNLFFARELASRFPKDSPLVINAVNPGFCFSAIRRDASLPRSIVFRAMETFLAWSTERGSRQLIFAALGNQDKPDVMKGAYISSSEIVEPSDYVVSNEGVKVQKQLWHETLTVLSKVSPNVQGILSSNNLL